MRQKYTRVLLSFLTLGALLFAGGCTASSSPLLGTWKSVYINSESAVIGYKDASLIIISDGTCIMKDKGEKDVEGTYHISPDTNTISFSFGVKLGGFTGKLENKELHLYNNYITIVFER